MSSLKTVWLNLGGKLHRVDLPQDTLQGALDCSVDGRTVRVDAQVLQPGVLSLVLDGRQYRCIFESGAVTIAGRRYAFEVNDPRSLQGRRGAGSGTDGPRPVKAPMPGRVVRLLVAAGDEVVEGQGIVVIEAMKMQNELKSPKAGRVARIAVAVDETVGSGDVLGVIE